MRNPASALGEAAGKLFEKGVIRALRPVVEDLGHTITPSRLKNGTGNTYQIDAVVFDANNRPIVIVDPKYIRYTKHNRDKASWLCTAHYNLRKTYPTLRKSVAVLGGRWSDPSIALLKSFGVEIVKVPFPHFCEVFCRYGVEFEWGERDRATPERALMSFENLIERDLDEVADLLVASVSPELTRSVETVLKTDMDAVPHHISSIEILVKTEHNEMLLYQDPTIADAINRLTGLMPGQTDVAGFIE